MHKGKNQIRKEILEKLYKQSKDEALIKSNVIKKRLFSLPEFKKSKTVMLYASRNEEVNTGSMIDEALEMGKKVALPRCTRLATIVPKEITNRKADLEKGTYGIYEPREGQRDVKPKDIDLVVVPGVAFDIENKRLGRGKGYYDRFLKSLPRSTASVGLAFDLQIVKDLPQDSQDVPVSKVITNK